MKRRTFISHTAQAAITVTFVASCKEADPYAGIERPSLVAYMDEVQLLQIGYLYGQEFEEMSNSSRTSSIQEDFDKGNTVIIDGWVLSKTEVHECLDFYNAVNSTKDQQ